MGDSITRCTWLKNAPQIYIDYHDDEWGIPSYDDHHLFEMLILESFHAGLSWLLILKKRDNFRLAFDNFDAEKIANYNDAKITELLSNQGIVRSQLKIKSTISNAKIYLMIKKEFGSFSNYLWGYSDYKIIKTAGEGLTSSELSDKLSKDLKKRGMKFVGTVTIYAYLQAIGIIDDHDHQCFKFQPKEKD